MSSVQSLPNGDKFDRTYTDFRKDTQNLFQKKENVHTLVARYEFQERRQLGSETVQDYITELRMLAANCAWENEEDMLAMRLIHGCSSTSAIGKFFQEHPDTKPDLDLVLGILTAEEKSRTGVKQLKGAASCKATRESNAVSNAEKEYSPRKNPSPTSTKCIFCGRYGHASSRQDESCPARKKECQFCQILGHFDTFCWKKNPELNPQSFQIRVIESTEEKKPGFGAITAMTEITHKGKTAQTKLTTHCQ